MDINKKTAIKLSTAIMMGDWDLVENLISDDFTYEVDGRPSINKIAYINFMKNVLCQAFTNMDMQFTHVITEGDLVAINYSNKMTHSGNFMGIEPTNKQVFATGQFIRQINNGKVVAEWQTTNAVGLIQQLKS